MKFDIAKKERYQIWALNGELNYHGYQKIENAFLESLDNLDRHVIVDLSQVSTIDSTGISALARCHVHVQRSGNRCLIAGAGKPLKQAFNSINLAAVMNFVDSVDEAQNQLESKT